MSLFDLEKRVDLPTEIKRLTLFIENNNIECMYRTQTISSIYRNATIFNYIETEFIKWENRGLAFNPHDYFNSFSIFSSISDAYTFLSSGECVNAEYLLYYLEFLLNQMYFLFLFDKSIFKLSDDENTFQKIVAIMNNINNIIDNINYTYDVLEKEKKVILRKRDAQLDAAINSINDKDITLYILSYLDHRNRDNIREKTTIIANLYKFFEKEVHNNTPTVKFKLNRKEKDIDLLSDFNFICNEFDMRHWPKNILKKTGTTNIPDNEMLELLDVCYYLALQIINSNHIVVNNKTVLDYKKKYEFI
ncbi:hypothetical protein ERUR111494_02405 [Erysipelothrix urinaevulpis]|uniref:hypothetical protein n=1 Tax=Erysipelothrix urinaevulpis TaxID=2683717 RepID=UPI00135B5791|nr:hypothetical protein [Erysipelothrix urinaevulpis]